MEREEISSTLLQDRLDWYLGQWKWGHLSAGRYGTPTISAMSRARKRAGDYW
jgi:hypothetical protein